VKDKEGIDVSISDDAPKKEQGILRCQLQKSETQNDMGYKECLYFKLFVLEFLSLEICSE